MSLSAYHQGSFVHVQVADDGRGIDPVLLRERAVRQGFLSPEAAHALGDREALTLVFLPGFSTAGEVTPASGRGRRHGRRPHQRQPTPWRDRSSRASPGSGTRITIKLPLTVVISDALLVRSGGETFAVPMNAIRSIVQVRPADIDAGGRERVVVEEEAVELVRLDRVLALPPRGRRRGSLWLVFRLGVHPLAVAVDELIGKEDIVIKSLGGLLERVGPFAGATISGAGRVILLVAPSRLAEAAEAARQPGRAAAGARARGAGRAAARARRILLVDDSISIRKFVGQMLEKAGFEVITANDGAEALRRLGDTAVDAVITNLEMPRVSGYELIEDLRARACEHEPCPSWC